MFVVKFNGVFGFIKPYSAVRDELIYSQKFLTPSILNGMEQKFFPELLKQRKCSKIIRHKLASNSISIQQETTKAKEGTAVSIIKRGILINPVLYLAFEDIDDAKNVVRQHICLCRNEDLMFADSEITEMSKEKFDELKGFEFFEDEENGIIVGFNRYDNFKPMKVTLAF